MIGLDKPDLKNRKAKADPTQACIETQAGQETERSGQTSEWEMQATVQREENSRSYKATVLAAIANLLLAM
jgi:hypothetical protein